MILRVGQTCSMISPGTCWCLKALWRCVGGAVSFSAVSRLPFAGTMGGSPRAERSVNWTPAALSGGQPGGRPARKRTSAPEGLTIERLTLGAGCLFVLVNLVVFLFFLPRHDLHEHHATPDELLEPPAPPPYRATHVPQDIHAPATSRPRPVAARSGLAPTQPARAPTHLAKVDEKVVTSAPTMMARWLSQCAGGPRCSCLVHGLGPSSEALFGAFPNVAFFVLLTGPSAQQLAARLSSAGHSHVYVLRADLRTRAPAPMANDVLNPRSERLSALHALRVSNEFFDLQIIYSSAPVWLRAPAAPDAKAILSLAAWTLVLLPDDATSASAWRAAVAHATDASSAASPAASGAEGEAIASTARVALSIAADGCVDNAAADNTGAISATRMAADRCKAGPVELPSLRDGGATAALLVELHGVRRLNAHHYSCWHSPRCHQRMYVMDLPAAEVGGADVDGKRARELLRRGWQRRVPRLYRVEDGTRFGSHNFSTLDEAWRMRGKDLGFDTGGINLDTAIGLQLAVGSRARLAAQFLALPVGRDMMLWNIIVGRRGLYAIDQEGHAFEDAAVPWGERVWPYCISVRDCYEKALAALCGRQRPSQPLDECFAALTQAQLCPDAAAPYPCPNGCMPSFLDCTHRGSKEQAFVGRAPS